MNHTTYLLGIILSLTFTINSQITYENRIEFEMKDGYIDEKIYEFGKAGFILSSKGDRTTKEGTEWKYEKFDLDLKSVDTKSVFQSFRFSNVETFTNENRMHSLFKDRKGNFSIITVEPSSLAVTKVEGKLPKKAHVKDMSVLGDFAFFSTLINRSPFLFSVNLKTSEQKLIPIKIDNIRPKKTSFLNFQVLENSNEIFVYAKAIIDKKRSDIYVIRLNEKGEKVGSFNLTKDIDENIINITASKLSEDKYVYTGTYSTKYIDQSEGLFFCISEKDKVDFIEFYNFLDLENFLSYLPERSQEKIEKKKEKKGKKLKIKYRIAAHDLMPIDGGYLFLGEAYFPTYRTETTRTTSTVNGVSTVTTTTTQVFDGYQYTHAILTKFDKNGKIIWDEIFELNPTYKPFFVKKFISISEKNESSLKLVFASRNRITSKSFDYEGSTIKDSQSDVIQTNFTGDKTKYSFSNIDYWYDNYFIAYGNQKIKNKEGNTNSKRKVFFINKIKYD